MFDDSEAVGESAQTNLAAAVGEGGAGGTWELTHHDARRLLAELALERRRFDVVDIDSFGSKQGPY